MTAGPIMIMAGGTGGHVYPGLAVAEALRRRDCGVVWLGTATGLEARVVPQHAIDIHFISIAGVRGKRLRAWLTAPFRILAAVLQAVAVLRRCRPAVVLGLGGFVSGPGGVAAWLTRRPLLIHEQNAVAGTTNRLLARFADRVFEAFPGSFPGLSAETIGNPLRTSILAVGPARAAPDPTRRRRLLVFGGSQGARALNRLVPAALALIDPAERPSVRHQAGREAPETETAYARLGVEADVVEYIEDMAAAYAWADLAVTRAGALTISELAAAGLGAVLIPLPHAIDDHQRLNAEAFVAGGAGRCLNEKDTDAAALAAALSESLVPDRLQAMAAAALAEARPDAADVLAAACIDAREACR